MQARQGRLQLYTILTYTDILTYNKLTYTILIGIRILVRTFALLVFKL